MVFSRSKNVEDQVNGMALSPSGEILEITSKMSRWAGEKRKTCQCLIFEVCESTCRKTGVVVGRIIEGVEQMIMM